MFNIYGIFCKTTYRVYYGKTTETIKERLQKHKDDYKSYLKGNSHYITAYEIIKNNNYEIKLLETCDNKNHMKEREGYYIRTFPCVNKNIPGRTKEQYYQDNREKILEERKEYYKENKEKKKEWREDNKVKISEYRKEYYEENRETILEKQKEKYTCACGSSITKQGKSQHEESIKHKKYLGMFF